MLSQIYTDPSMAEIYEARDIHDFGTGLVQLPKIYDRESITENQDWPEQQRGIKPGTVCSICKEDLMENPADATEGTFEIVPAICCKHPFHSACLSTHLLNPMDGRATCPLCRDPWGGERASGMIAVMLAQMEDVEKGWRNKMSRRRLVGA